MNIANPFTPTFGITPQYFVGRDKILSTFMDGLKVKTADARRMLLLSGARGVGKTVALNALENTAIDNGWLVISETAIPGLKNRLVMEHLPTLLSELDPKAQIKRITGVQIPAGLGGVNFHTEQKYVASPSLRSQLTTLCDFLGKHSTGLVLSIDELHTGALADLQEIAATIQHLFREGRPIALIMAGLPENIDKLLDAPGITFLRRAQHEVLGALDYESARLALELPIQSEGLMWHHDALQNTLEISRGYPYLIQALGSCIFDAAMTLQQRELTLELVKTAAESALTLVGMNVHRPILRSLSDREQAFLYAMAQDEGFSRVSDIAQRLDVSSNYISQYRIRLMNKHVVYSPVHGKISFAMPGMREFLRRNKVQVLPMWEEKS
ncbi:ATP-binding protein [Corynebacterium sp. sy017]|uniref:ATP-binding protein n=1 Tax=unclassified Corynebacterium TaxID=2624378 RepID=UPI0011861D51|nr:MULTISPECIES: ATP-binding protein [unclassified Corynebacterium]MBP3088702.1 ATP-binding protein [Corynebacterium sp. sy017]QDZ42103.1 ATP-binding protein [Corynebacterium sp. sy039]TSD91989.1 ATP-binding protein [Corynebacterium sp. SY003]